MKKSKILLGIILFLFVVSTHNTASVAIEKNSDDFLWKIHVMYEHKMETYFTNDPINADHRRIACTSFKNLYQLIYKYKNGEFHHKLGKRIKERSFLNLPIIVIRRTKDYKKHQEKIKKELKPNTLFWEVKIENYKFRYPEFSIYHPWRTQQKPIITEADLTTLPISYLHPSQVLSIEFPYAWINQKDDTNKIKIPLIENITFMNIQATITTYSYTNDEKIDIMDFTNKDSMY